MVILGVVSYSVWVILGVGGYSICGCIVGR